MRIGDQPGNMKGICMKDNVKSNTLLHDLAEAFKADSDAYQGLETPKDPEGKRRLLRSLMNNHYVFSDTQVNADELQQYREESDSVLSFVKDYCESCINGHFYGFEVKAENGKPTKLQEATIQKILAAGGTALVVRSVDEVRAAVNSSLH